MADSMTFPDTVEEFMEQYKVVDTEQVYTNGTEFVPIYRMKQWFEHLSSVQPYTDEEIQKMQDMEQAQLEKAFELGREDAKPQWIPCSERLPEVGAFVLVSKKAFPPNVCMAHRSRDPRSGKEAWNDMLFGKLNDDKVLAWMPLPEPYQEEGEK